MDSLKTFPSYKSGLGYIGSDLRYWLFTGKKSLPSAIQKFFSHLVFDRPSSVFLLLNFVFLLNPQCSVGCHFHLPLATGESAVKPMKSTIAFIMSSHNVLFLLFTANGQEWSTTRICSNSAAFSALSPTFNGWIWPLFHYLMQEMLEESPRNVLMKG